MDIPLAKKREGEKIAQDDISPHQIKRPKLDGSNIADMFFRTLSELDDWKKNIIRKLGFGALLQFSCSSNVTGIFYWLVEHMDTDSATVTLEHGFSFTLSALIVNIILGLPLGNKTVHTKVSKTSCDIMHQTVQCENPSVEYMCSMLSQIDDRDEVTFSRIFMLAALSAFIAPNGRGGVSTRYYEAVIDYASKPDHDWCSFALNWLVLNIKKFKTNKEQGVVTEIGGCKIIPVLAYFEFLITSEFNMGNTVPRLPLWTTNIVNSYIALDSFNASPQKFGRLSRKHISSTIFRGICQIPSTEFKMPVAIQEYIIHKLRGSNLNSHEKRRLELLAQNFFVGLMDNSIPTMQRYIDDMIMLSQHNQKSPRAILNDSELQVKTSTLNRQPESESMVYKHFSTLEREDISGPFIGVELLTRKLFSQDKIEFEYSSELMMQQLLQKMNSCNSEDTNWGFQLPPASADFEASLLPQPASGEFQDSLLTHHDAFSLECSHSYSLIDLITYKLGNSEPLLMPEQKFSDESMSFFLPGQVSEENFGIFREQPCLDKGKGNLFLLTNQNSIYPEHSPVLSNRSQSVPFKKLKTEKHVTFSDTAPPHNKSRGHLRGLSLNEILRGKKNEPCFQTDSMPPFPSFDLLDISDADTPPSEIFGGSHSMIKQGVFSISDKARNDPQLQIAMDQFTREMVGTDNQRIKATTSAVQKQNPKQVFFSTAFEHDFYTMLTANTAAYSPRIFEIKKTWVDQRTLTLSMRQGGWINPRVMDSFGRLVREDQYQRDQEGTLNNKEILKFVFIKDEAKILMDPTVNHSDPCYKYLFCPNKVGQRLDKTGLVHIPCQLDKQWIDIVANFIDNTFDVLNPDTCNEKFSNIIGTVVHNFKIFFVKDYPHNRYFNINDFKIRYVKVPKHNFRYDSGIFVMKFIASYNGIEVLPFSNDDIEALREKLTCQLVLSRYNEHQVPVVKDFLAKNAPHMVR